MVDASRIIRELMHFTQDQSVVGITLEPDEKNIRHLTATIVGLGSSPYEGGTFNVDITVPDDYPFAAPIMRFTTKVWHPNISSQTGAICVDHLKNNWSPVLNLKTALLSLQAMLSTPDPNDPQDPVVAQQALSDYEAFVATAKQWTKEFAMGSSAGSDVKVDEMGYTEALVKMTLEDKSMALDRLRPE